MNRFEYARPATTAEAVQLLSSKSGETEVLAGGTDLLSLLKDFLVEPKRVVSVMGIGELKGVATVANGGLRIGATTTLDELLEKVDLRSGCPALHQAVEGIRSPQLRAMGTVGGELLQRPRCWYFRRGFGLLAQKDGRSMVVDGDSRYHAIFGNAGKAKYVSPSSLAPALIALGASAELLGPNGVRTIAVADLYRTPQGDGEREFNLAGNELLTAIVLPGPRLKSATYEVRPRQGLDWPLATASVNLSLDGKKVTEAEIVLGHVAPTPWRAQAAAQSLVGKELDAKTAAAAAQAAVVGATPLARNAYKMELAQVATRRALLRAIG